MRRTIPINKVRLADVKEVLFKKFVYVKDKSTWKKGLFVSFFFFYCSASLPAVISCLICYSSPPSCRHWALGSFSLPSSCGTSFQGHTTCLVPCVTAAESRSCL